MRVKFEYTQEDLFDAAHRVLARSKVLTAGMRRTALFCGLLAGSVVFLIFARNLLAALVVGAIAAVIGFLLFPSVHRREIDKRIRQAVQKQMAEPGVYTCEVELQPEGVWARQRDRQVLFEWASVQEVQETADSVDIFTRHGEGVVIRNRAFASAEERARFVESARTSMVNHR